MKKSDVLICTRCGSHHLEIVNETEFKCLNCDAIIFKEKAINFEKDIKKIIKEGKEVDIKNLRELVNKSLDGHLDKPSLIIYSQEILKLLPDDTLSNFYIKYANRDKDPSSYEEFLKKLINSATITEMDDIINIIVLNIRIREKDYVEKLTNYFYKDKYNYIISESIKRRHEEVELFSDIKRDVFICWSSKDKEIAHKILDKLEKDGNTCWISSRNIPWDSDNYWMNITKAIKSCDIFLCINSKNTMDSSDCRHEIEIAMDLNKKKRIEYKLDETPDITLFKNFFTGQWITNINDLKDKVYVLKNKEKTLKEKALTYLNNKKYDNAKEIFEEMELISDDSEIDTYINIIDVINSATALINKNMYEEAKIKLLQINDIKYTKELLDICNKKGNDDNQVNINYLLDVKKDYSKAESLIYDNLAYNYDNYDLWFLYLKAITKNYKISKHENLEITFNNLFRLCPNERRDELNKIYKDFDFVKIEKDKKKKSSVFCLLLYIVGVIFLFDSKLFHIKSDFDYFINIQIKLGFYSLIIYSILIVIYYIKTFKKGFDYFKIEVIHLIYFVIVSICIPSIDDIYSPFFSLFSYPLSLFICQLIELVITILLVNKEQHKNQKYGLKNSLMFIITFSLIFRIILFILIPLFYNIEMMF